MNSFIPVNVPLVDGNEGKYLDECIRTGWISSEGPFVSQFEEQFSKRVGRKFGVAVTNGTAALDAAIAALGIGEGDEVILPSFTIISCVGQIVRSGATPVLIDSCADTWNMDISQIEAKISNRTKAIMVVHIFGLPVDVEPVLVLARKYGLKVIEDAAQMIGQDCRGKPCGSFGDISTFSFYPNKHVTTGEGGMIVTDDEELAQKCSELRNLCFTRDRFVHERLGWNLRMTNLQAAVGLAQLERLDEFVTRKRRMGAIYSELLSDVSGIQLPVARTDYAENIYWVFGIVLEKELGIDAKQMMVSLAELNIGTRPFFYPMHMQPVLKEMGMFKDLSLPVSKNLYRRGFYIPSGLALEEAQMVSVAQAVADVIKNLK